MGQRGCLRCIFRFDLGGLFRVDLGHLVAIRDGFHEALDHLLPRAAGLQEHALQRLFQVTLAHLLVLEGQRLAALLLLLLLLLLGHPLLQLCLLAGVSIAEFVTVAARLTVQAPRINHGGAVITLVLLIVLLPDVPVAFLPLLAALRHTALARAAPVSCVPRSAARDAINSPAAGGGRAGLVGRRAGFACVFFWRAQQLNFGLVSLAPCQHPPMCVC